ncbi:MAG TPA: trypsin-like peptidase domain-containing protein [Pirellulales bacterium]|nr:trypsin-like peptidase domain-containing protein [Pirellulales bacterium]
MKYAVRAMFAAAVWVAVAASLNAEDAVRDSVVKIAVTQRAPNFFQPWTKSATQEASGTGFIIAGRRILTNAHVVQYASQIYVQPHQSADKLPAKVLAMSQAIDLAVLDLTDDDSFFDSRPPLELAEGLPQVKGTVNVYGYPLGGEQMSVTEGIISRVDFAGYYYRTTGLRVQIDAALNPGNSGGPALSDGRVVGVAFSGIKTAENIGYLIPVEEINAFLADVADGHYDGKPRLRDETQTLENDAIRKKLGLGKGVGGAMITRPHGGGEDYPLRRGDVILKIGDHALDNASRVQVASDLQLPFQYLIPKLAQEGKVKFTVLRDGETLEIETPVTAEESLAIPYLHGDYPRYFIYGPLVFSPASQEFMALLTRTLGAALIDRGSPLIKRLTDRPAFEGEEVVIVPSPMFPHALVKGYSAPTFSVLSRVNGIPVRNLKHLVELLKYNTAEYLEFRFPGAETLVFRREEMNAATEAILTDNSIRKQCSEDLEAVWKAK